MEYLNGAAAYFRELADLSARIDHEAVERFAGMLFDAWRERRRVFVFGNGGSAHNAGHHVCDYVKTAAVDGHVPLQAFSLVDSVGMGTAIANDQGFDQTFRFPLSAYAQPGDLAVALSCSGRSPNVVRACEWAAEHGVLVVALTGFDGGLLGGLAAVHINVPSENYGLIEDLHLSIGHIVSQHLRARLLASAAEAAPG